MSAFTAQGLEEVEPAIVNAVLGGVDGRHGGAAHRLRAPADLLKGACRASLLHARRTPGRSPPDLLAVDLAAALDALGEITGEVTSAEILERMFSRFCVGK